MEKVTRVCLIGPECTGKTELSAELGRHYGAPVVPEFAREHALAHGELTYADVEPIAKGEMAAIDVARALRPRLLIEDTDLISTVVYSRYYYGQVPDWIVEAARSRKADLYLLMDTDIEWRADPARDAGGEAREELFDLFRRALDEFETRWAIVSGDWEQRYAAAIEAINHVC